jgi:ergothioneine biosynthesis protein EgtB
MTTPARTSHTFSDEARAALLARFDRGRARTRRLFDLLTPAAYYSRPIALRNPIVFYEGHVSAFAVNTLLKRGLGERGIDAELERLFARGIDPEDESKVDTKASWPSRERVLAYVAEADARLRAAISDADLDVAGHPLLERAEAAYAIVEHEEMHQETLHYIWHRLDFDQKRPPSRPALESGAAPPDQDQVEIPAGRATLGVRRADVPFAWDNEQPRHVVDVDAFAIDRHNVTNHDFLAFVDAGGYTTRDLWRPEAWAWLERERVTHPLFWERASGGQWVWRAMFESLPLPMAWPVYVTLAEARAYARWRGRRLMTEAEYQRAAFGTPSGDERTHPWGDAAPDDTRGRFGEHFDPVPAGSRPAGQSAWGVHDLTGNGWEWTDTPFAPFDGFRPLPSYPEYSADFFDHEHFVIKGASPATPVDTLRPSFRNWFRPHYPYVYATFRCLRA